MAFTKEQELAINTEGKNIIVSAGAGSGKTAVLTARVIRKLTSNIDIDHLLVLTFTNEAAKEMQNRIRDAIIKNNLLDQLPLLSSSYITTFDSFTLSLVKKYHYLLNISKNIKIIDNDIITIYKYKVLDTIFEKKYGEISFDNLISSFFLKDDKIIKNFIIELSKKLDLLVDKETYLDNYVKEYYEENYLKNIINDYQEIIKNKINDLTEIYNSLIYYLDNNMITKLNSWISPLLNGNTYSEYIIFNTIPTIRFTKLTEEAIPLKEELKNKIEEIKELLRFSSEEEIINTIKSTKENIEVIIEIIKELDKEVIEYKNKHETYEFNDISHMAISILKNNPEIRDELKYFFNEIMIDEYQDTSTIQETFINYIENNNVYMVGDIKQSIYRFRNANPYIFEEKYNKYANLDGGIKIDLLKNFRSRSETLTNINEIFNLIMDNNIGNANYQKEHNMIYGNTDYDKESTNVNNLMEIYNYQINKNEYETYEEKELFIISKDIEEKIKNNYKVYDKSTGLLRNIKYSDICIITDRNKYLPLYKKILEYNEIPSVLYMDETLTNDNTILVIKNLIHLVYLVNNHIYDDNFRYLYTSVSRSFLFNYSDDEIYQTITNKNYSKTNIVKKCKEIDINNHIKVIINDILNTFSVYEKLITLNDIEKNIVRISNLIDLANSLSSLGYTIKEFIEYLNETIDIDLPIKYSVNTKNQNAIKIMNIHKSKGLEFSLCYYTGLYNKFTIKETKSKFLVNNKYGIIMPYIKDNEVKETILKDLFIDDYYKEEISEKIRLFYVALTRCREKMIILAPLSQDNETYHSLVPDTKRLKYRSFLDIINSLSITSKYITNKEIKYNKNYRSITIKSLKENKNNLKIIKKINNLKYEKITNESFSKETNKIMVLETIKNMEYGTKIHELLEFADFNNPKDEIVKSLLTQIDKNFINIYHEYEFIYTEKKVEYHGIIDLLVEYNDKIYIIDYKLKSTDDIAYIKQLTGYKNYITNITNKIVKTYLYSILDNKIKEITI